MSQSVGELGGLSGVGEDIAAAVPGMLLLATSTLALLGLVEFVERRWHPHKEHTRKAAHAAAGLIACAAPAYFASHWPMLVLCGALTLLLLGTRRLGLLAPLHAAGRRTAGDLLYPPSLYAAFVLAHGDALVFRAAVLVLAFADPAAALVGRRYGRLRCRVAGTTRSLEGSLAFAAVAFAVVWPALYLWGRVDLLPAALYAGAVATTATAIEAMSPFGFDNLTIPTGVVLVLKAWVP